MSASSSAFPPMACFSYLFLLSLSHPFLLIFDTKNCWYCASMDTFRSALSSYMTLLSALKSEKVSHLSLYGIKNEKKGLIHLGKHL